jgi:ferredoxin
LVGFASSVASLVSPSRKLQRNGLAVPSARQLSSPLLAQPFESVEPSAATTEFLVQVQFDDFAETDSIYVRRGETLLSALERAASQLGWSEVPSDCRRGNCLTCTARHTPESSTEHVQPLTDDGLSPDLSIDGEEYLLTCKSTVTGPGVVLQVGQNSALWKHVYQSRFEDESTRRAADAAIARVLRKAAEKDPEGWRVETEVQWDKRDETEPDSDALDESPLD